MHQSMTAETINSPVDTDALSLDKLPTEMLLLIFDCTDVKTIVQSLMYVNKQFYNIISDTYLWKKRFMRQFNNYNVAFMLTESFKEDTFNWKKFFMHSETEKDCWSNYETNTTSTIFRGVHFSEVDAVMMAKESSHCMSGSRDRTMCLWDTRSTTDDGPIVHKTDGHSGWIWDLQMYDLNHFLSCSWDSSVKLWNLNNFSPNANPIQAFQTSSAVLSITSKLNFVAAGLYTSRVIAFDPREDGRSLFEINPHRRSIIDVCLIQDNFLVSLSEDKTMSVWDLRTNKRLKLIVITKHGGTGFPMCASYYNNVLFVGDSQNNMFWFDCSNGLFNYLETMNLMPSSRYKLNEIKCTSYGSIVCGGNEGIINIITPTNPQQTIARIKNSEDSEITSIDYQNDTLVVGYVSSAVQIWKKNA